MQSCYLPKKRNVNYGTGKVHPLRVGRNFRGYQFLRRNRRLQDYFLIWTSIINGFTAALRARAPSCLGSLTRKAGAVRLSSRLSLLKCLLARWMIYRENLRKNLSLEKIREPLKQRSQDRQSPQGYAYVSASAGPRLTPRIRTGLVVTSKRISNF